MLKSDIVTYRMWNFPSFRKTLVIGLGYSRRKRRHLKDCVSVNLQVLSQRGRLTLAKIDALYSKIIGNVDGGKQAYFRPEPWKEFAKRCKFREKTNNTVARLVSDKPLLNNFAEGSLGGSGYPFPLASPIKVLWHFLRGIFLYGRIARSRFTFIFLSNRGFTRSLEDFTRKLYSLGIRLEALPKDCFFFFRGRAKKE